MIHCPPASITSTVLLSSSSTSCAGLPEPSIRVPLRTTRVFLLAAVMMILPVADRTMDVTSKRAASSTAIGSSCETLAARAAAVVSSRRMGLIFSAGEEWRHGRQAIRPLDTGSRQHRQSRAPQSLHQPSAPADLLLHHRPP